MFYLYTNTLLNNLEHLTCYENEVGTVNVLMLGWEFPPYFAGGIGVVCYQLTKALSRQGVDVTYIMPFGPRNIQKGNLHKLLIAENIAPRVTVHTVKTTMHAYMTAQEYKQEYTSTMLEDTGSDTKKQLYGKDLMQEVHNFAHRTAAIAEYEEFDLIHCHDWMTIPAAAWIKQRTQKPLVLHVHNTIYDRYLSGSNKVEYDIEQLGLREADIVVCVSHYVRNNIINNYDVNPEKVLVVHNAMERLDKTSVPAPKITSDDKIVLFAGRITAQKGPEYFLHAAQHVANHDPNVKFVMAGSGDMLHRMIDLAADLGLADKVLFPGYYTRDDVDRLFGMADVFVMPSVSEPFGIVPLEAMSKGTPTIISRQSGVSEVLSHVLKVDFWDTEELAEKILAVLKYEELHESLSQHGNWEAKTLTWEGAAQKIRDVYATVIPHTITH